MGKRGGRRRNRASEWAEEKSTGDAPKKRQKVADTTSSSNAVDRVEVCLVGVIADSSKHPLPAPFSLDFGTTTAGKHDESTTTSSFSNSREGIQSVWKYLGHNHKPENWKPSQIQQQLWSLLLETQWNTIGVAPTGSGKTFSYAIPTVVSIMVGSSSSSSSSQSSAAILALVPTRELAQQVAKVFVRVCKAMDHLTTRDDDPINHHSPISKSAKSTIPVVTVQGGANRLKQQEELRAAAKAELAVVVATPGRLLDLIQDHQKDTTSTSQLLLPAFRWIILDEADQLAKDGDLGPQVDEILEATQIKKPSHEETRLVLVSATYPEKSRSKFEDWVGKQYALAQVDHVQQTAVGTAKDGEGGANNSEANKSDSTIQPVNKNSGSFARIPPHLEQILHVCSEHKKPKKLLHTLQQIYKQFPNQRSRPLGIIFFKKIEKVKHIAHLLEKEGVEGGIELHSQLGSSHLREANLAQFACGQKPLLLATDLAARGIDVPSVQFVIQYDFPGNLQQYVHRCGRAGRSYEEDTGKPKPAVYSFFTRNLKPMASDLIQLLEANQAWIDPNLRDLAREKLEPDKKPKKPFKEAHGKQQEASSQTTSSKANSQEDDDNIDDFPNLAADRIVLKRASHVSDASSSSEDEDGDDADDS